MRCILAESGKGIIRDRHEWENRNYHIHEVISATQREPAWKYPGPWAKVIQPDSEWADPTPQSHAWRRGLPLYLRGVFAAAQKSHLYPRPPEHGVLEGLHSGWQEHVLPEAASHDGEIKSQLTAIPGEPLPESRLRYLTQSMWRKQSANTGRT